MSFGQKHSAWARPQGQQQQINPNLFTNQLGLAATGQAFSAIPGMALNSGLAGLVNQAAFTNTMNMNTMNSMLAQAQRSQMIQQPPQQQIQQSRQPPPQQQQATSPTRSQRTFIGLVTKLMETYGFVDEDVFFQTNVIRGSVPRVGDRVMVEANYNPSMPFKWNAYRIQLIQDNTQQQQPPRQPQQQQQQNGGGVTRWGERAIRDEPSRRQAAVASRRSPQKESQSKRPSSRQRSPQPQRRTSPRKRESPRREAPQKRERERDDRSLATDRGESAARGHSLSKRDTASPPRRRQRIIPRYHCNQPKQTLPIGDMKYADMRRRYANLYIPSDFMRSNFDWIQSIKLDQPIKFSPHPIVFHVLHKDVDIPLADGEQLPPENPPDADYRYIVKVLLISHPGLSAIRQKMSGLLPDGSIDESAETQPITKNIQLLVGHKTKGEYMCIGGAWSPSLDGQNPMDPQTMVKTAMRTTRALSGIDLSACSRWYKMVHLRYFRVERQRIDSVVLMLPDTSTVPSFKVTEEGHQLTEQLLRDQLASKLSAIDAKVFSPPGQTVPSGNIGQNSTADPSSDQAEKMAADAPPVVNEGGVEITAGSNQQAEGHPESSTAPENEQNLATTGPEAMDTSQGEQAPESSLTTSQSTESVQTARTPVKKEIKTHWSVLEPNVRAMKVAELREELELRVLDSKGVKNVLMQRLLDAIEKEKALAKEDAAPAVEQQTEKPQTDLQEQPRLTIDEPAQQEMEQNQAAAAENEPQQAQTATDGGTQPPQQAEAAQEEAAKSAPPAAEKQSIMVQIKEEIIELMETDATEEKKETEEEKLAREKAEKEQKELEKAKEKFEKEKKERKATLERHYGQIQKEPGIFVYPSKTAKSGKFDLKLLSLHSLLDYRTDDSKESSFEVFLFAEALREALDRSYAFTVYHSISTALDKDAEKKRRDEKLAEACKDEDIVVITEEGGKKDGKEKEEKAGTKSPTNTVDLRTNFKALVSDFDIFTAFVHFDSNICGYIADRDLEEIIHSVGLDLPRGEVQRLVKKLSSKERLNYRNLTDKWVDKEGDVKYVPTPAYESMMQSLAEHAKGHSNQLETGGENVEKEGGTQQDVSESGIVFFNGTLVNVKHCLEQQVLMEQERQIALDRNDQLELQLKSTKENRDQLEKKKRRLEDDVDRYKKKLHDTEKSLRKEQEDSAAAKKGLQDCKRYGERIVNIVGAIMPPPKPKESTAEKEKSESSSEKEKNGTGNKEKEVSGGDIVLVDEATGGGNGKESSNNDDEGGEVQKNGEQEQQKEGQQEEGANAAKDQDKATGDKTNEEQVQGGGQQLAADGAQS